MPTYEEIHKFQIDVLRGGMGGGVPSAVHMIDAAIEQDYERVAYHAAVEGTVFPTPSIIRFHEILNLTR